jgi:cellobiose-specific phosphotransferase system component IIA
MALVSGIGNSPDNLTAIRDFRIAWKKVSLAVKNKRKAWDNYMECVRYSNSIQSNVIKALRDNGERTSEKPDHHIHNTPEMITAIVELARQNNLDELRRYINLTCNATEEARKALMELIRQNNLVELRRHNTLMCDAAEEAREAWKELEQAKKPLKKAHA